MRRLSLTLIASCGVALLSACNGGGYAFTGTNSNNNVTAVAFQNGSGQLNDFFVSPNGSSPIEVNAIAYQGTGAGSQVVPDVKFQWQVGFAPAGTTFPVGSSGTQTACGTPSQPAVPQYYTLLQQSPSSTGPVPSPSAGAGVAPTPGEASPQFPGYVIASPGFTSSTIFVGVPLDPTKLPAVVPITGTNYCLQVDAIYKGATVGSAIVVVGNAP